MRRSKRLIVANWKMNPGTLNEARKLFRDVAKKVARARHSDVVICPPILYLADLMGGYSGSKILFGAQDISLFEKNGSFTGEVSGTMLKRAGATYVVVGHSERRSMGETDSIVAGKTLASLRSGLIPIVCVGEHRRDEGGEYLRGLEQQIRASLALVPKNKSRHLIVAYEPLWAIGKSTKEAIGAHELHETALFVRKILVRMFGRKEGSSIRILYGGSVEPGNDDSLTNAGGIDGFLVGHASLRASDFASIVL